MATTIEIEDRVTVGDLADKLMLPVTKLIAELMKMALWPQLMSELILIQLKLLLEN